jgi:hypothetical protein
MLARQLDNPEQVSQSKPPNQRAAVIRTCAAREEKTTW